MSASVNASGLELVEQLRAVGYEQIAKSDGHIVLETERNGTHRIVLPDRDRLSEETVIAVMKEAGSHVGRRFSDFWRGAKPTSQDGSVVVHREGIGQVRLSYDKDGKLVSTPITEPVQDTQAPHVRVPRDKKLREWIKLRGYASGSRQEWPMPQWAWNAYFEMQRMYFPELWNRFTTCQAFLNDPFQKGLLSGYELALCVATMDDSTLLNERPEDAIAAKIAARSERPGHIEKIERVCEEWSLPQLRRYFEGFTRALAEDAVYLETGIPTAASDRFQVLRFLLDNRGRIEDARVKKRRTIPELHRWLTSDLKSYHIEVKTLQNLCDQIGLRLRPHQR